MRAFTRKEIVHHETWERTGYIPVRGTISIPFEVEKSDGPVTHRLRLLGEPDYFWKWRTEWGSPYAIAMSIDDVLTTRDTYNETFSLEFPCHGDTHPRNAYIKLYQNDLHPGAGFLHGYAPCTQDADVKCVFSIPVKTADFKCLGEAGAHLEIYYAKKGRHPNDVFDAPDKVIDLEFPEGTGDWRVLKKSFTMPRKAVCAIMRVGGEVDDELPVKRVEVAGSPEKLFGRLRSFVDAGFATVFSVPNHRARKDIELALVDYSLPFTEVLDSVNDSSIGAIPESERAHDASGRLRRGGPAPRGSRLGAR